MSGPTSARSGWAMACASVLWLALAPEGAAAEPSRYERMVTDAAMSIKVDPVGLIEAVAAKRRQGFKISAAAAIVRMDSLLTSYGAKGRLANEPDAQLRLLYGRAAELLMNGQAIAGGTLVAVARSTPSFARSPSGAALGAFVDAMLQPTEDDEDLAQMKGRGKRAAAALAALRDDLRWYATLWIMGAIYRDVVAVDAGRAGVDAMMASAAERRVIEQALAVQ